MSRTAPVCTSRPPRGRSTRGERLADRRGDGGAGARPRPRKLGYSRRPARLGAEAGGDADDRRSSSPTSTTPTTRGLIRGIARVLEDDEFVPVVAETGESRGAVRAGARPLRPAAGRRADHLGGAPRRGGDLCPQLADGCRWCWPAAPAGDRLQRGDPRRRAGGAFAAEHLASLGHGRVAQLAGPADIDAFIRRAQAFTRAVSAGGMKEIRPSAATAPRRPSSKGDG